MHEVSTNSPTDQEIHEAHSYLLSRLLVLRQQRHDFEKEGFIWNSLIHRKRGGVDWPNPCLDVVYSEAWVTVDEKNSVLLEVPLIEGRYFTWHMLNGWGETVLNINDRTFPDFPHGRYALCLAGTEPPLPDNAMRVDLPASVTRVLLRIEIGADGAEAVRLQHDFRLTPIGRPAEPAYLHVPDTDDGELFGVEVFDCAVDILEADDDLNEGMDAIRSVASEVATLVASGFPGRTLVQNVLAQQTRKALITHLNSAVVVRNGWICHEVIGRYGSDYRRRTAVNLTGIWANTPAEYTVFSAARLDGSTVHTLTYSRKILPENSVDNFWSITLVDGREYRVVPNPIGRHLLGSRSNLVYDEDGSLTLVFAPELPPGHPESNWLPTPRAKTYNLTYRLYGPTSHVRVNGYCPPELVEVPIVAPV